MKHLPRDGKTGWTADATLKPTDRRQKKATVPAGKNDPMGARVVYSSPADAFTEYRMCLNELETAKRCDGHERALIKTQAPGATTFMNAARRPRSGPNHIAYLRSQHFVLSLMHLRFLLKEHQRADTICLHVSAVNEGCVSSTSKVAMTIRAARARMQERRDAATYTTCHPRYFTKF